MIQIPVSNDALQLRFQNERREVYCPIRKRWFLLTPEEHVRQVLLQFFFKEMNYPKAMLAVERKIDYGTFHRRFDVVVFSKKHLPWMLVECKEPSVNIGIETLHQLVHYHSAIPCRYWVLSNGVHTFCADAGDVQQIKWLEELPAYD